MIYINKKNLYIRVILALVVIASVWLSFQGGVDFVNAKATADVPDPYEPTNPLTKKALQKHVTSVALNNNYTVDYKKSIRTEHSQLERDIFLVKVSNTETKGYKLEQTTGKEVDTKFKEQYETKESIYTNEDGEITTTKREEDFDSPILQNQFKNAGHGLNTFKVFTWTVTEVTEDKIVYDLARADAVAVPSLNTIDNASGKIVINRDTGYIETLQVHLFGSSTDHPNETVYVHYTYDVSSGDTEVSEPNWIPDDTN